MPPTMAIFNPDIQLFFLPYDWKIGTLENDGNFPKRYPWLSEEWLLLHVEMFLWVNK